METVSIIGIVLFMSIVVGTGHWILLQGHKAETILPIGTAALPLGQVIGLCLSWGGLILVFFLLRSNTVWLAAL